MIHKYKLEPQKILSLYDIFGDFRNNQMIERWIANKLERVPEGKVLLDAGAGECRYEPYCQHLKYIAQDFGKYHADVKWGGLHPDKWDASKVNITCDIIDMPLDNESVDVILCSEVFEHLKNPVLAIKEFSRVLKSGGELILTAPFCSLTHMAPYYFCNGFSKYWYEENLDDFGFTIKEIVPNGNFFKYLCQELLRIDKMANRYCQYKLSEDDNSVVMGSIQLLSRLAERDIGSDEILCFGYMVHAQKR